MRREREKEILLGTEGRYLRTFLEKVLSIEMKARLVYNERSRANK